MPSGAAAVGGRGLPAAAGGPDCGRAAGQRPVPGAAGGAVRRAVRRGTVRIGAGQTRCAGSRRCDRDAADGSGRGDGRLVGRGGLVAGDGRAGAGLDAAVATVRLAGGHPLSGQGAVRAGDRGCRSSYNTLCIPL